MAAQIIPFPETGKSPHAPATQRWLNSNPWFDHEGYEVITMMARHVDSHLFSEGWPPDDDQYFVELDRRLFQHWFAMGKHVFNVS